MDRFPICFPITDGWEGGWSNNAADPGGKTMYGITETRWWEYQDANGWKRTPVSTVTTAMAYVFYRSEYWDKCGAPNLFPGVDLAIFDVSVNSGISRGLKYRNQTADIAKADERVKAICRARLSFMQGLKIWNTFGKGWGRRVADIEARGVMMAMEAMGHAPEVRKAAAVEATQSAQSEQAMVQKTAKTVGTTGTATSGVGVAGSFTNGDHRILYVVGAIILIGIIGSILLYARHKALQARADAYSSIQGEQK